MNWTLTGTLHAFSHPSLAFIQNSRKCSNSNPLLSPSFYRFISSFVSFRRVRVAFTHKSLCCCYHTYTHTDTERIVDMIIDRRLRDIDNKNTHTRTRQMVLQQHTMASPHWPNRNKRQNNIIATSNSDNFATGTSDLHQTIFHVLFVQEVFHFVRCDCGNRRKCIDARLCYTMTSRSNRFTFVSFHHFNWFEFKIERHTKANMSMHKTKSEEKPKHSNDKRNTLIGRKPILGLWFNWSVALIMRAIGKRKTTATEEKWKK